MGDTTVDPEILRRCAVVWEQVGMNQRLPGWESLPASARHVRFAELSFPILWPFNCVDPRNRYDPPKFPWGAWPYGDRIALQVAKEGLRGPAAVAAYVERGSRVIPNPERMLDMETARSRKRDANVDLSMTNYVLQHFRQKRLFATYNHASNALIWEMFEQLMGNTVLPDLAVGAEEFARCRAAFMAPDLVFPNFDNFQMPIHPGVVSGYDLEWVNETTVYRYFDEGRFNFADFMTKYIEYPFPQADAATQDVSIAGRDPVEAKTPDESVDRERLSYAKLTGCPPIPSEPPIISPLGSRLCRQADIVTDSFRYWITRMNRTPVMNRRYWEWYYIAQTLWQRGLLVKGARGVGFDDADSPLAELFKSLGCNIVLGDFTKLGILETNPADPAPERIAPRLPIAAESNAFDFSWSSACLSNLGSIKNGYRAIAYSLSLLRNGPHDGSRHNPLC
jgi:hypothetical protein